MRIQQKQLPTHSAATVANVVLGTLLVVFLLGILVTIAAFSFQEEEKVGETMGALTPQPLQTISMPPNYEGNLLLSAGTKTVVLLPRDRVIPNHTPSPISQEQPQLKSTEEARPAARGLASVKVENSSPKGKHYDGWSLWHFTVISLCALISLGWSMVVANRVMDRWIAEDGDDDLPENDNENFKRSIMDGVGSEVSQLGYQSCTSSGWSGLPFDKFDL